MFDEAARAVLQQPLIARLAVNGPDGYPHVVPIWFMLDGDDIVMVTPDDAAKARYLAQDTHAAVTVGGDPDNGGTHRPGYLIKGRILLTPDEEAAWLRKITYHYEEPEQAEKDLVAWTADGAKYVILRLKPVKIVKVM
jgi:nitroimidazol reductase NimA-like FMN-containing flavoprotein (pyridoxamine 5'-phosphate oxidase superfamily)